MSDILAEELQKTKNEEEYMINTFIVMQRWVLGSEALFFYLVYVHWAACSLSGWLCCSSFATKSGREGGKVVSGTFVFFHCLFCGYCLLFLWDVRRKTPTLSHPPKKKWYPTSKLLNVWLAVFLFSVLWLWMCGSQDSGMNFLIIFWISLLLLPAELGLILSFFLYQVRLFKAMQILKHALLTPWKKKKRVCLGIPLT